VHGAEDSGRDSGEGGGMSIKRYTVIFEEEHIGECETGKFVLYADVLAALAEKDADWQLKYDILMQDYEQKWGLSMRQAETITALQEQVNNDDEIKASYRETLGKLVPLELEMKKQIAALTARIKELEEALEKILLCSGGSESLYHSA
jgi:hypothetical protein